MLGWDDSRSGFVVMVAVMMAVAIVSTAVRFWSRAVVLKGRYELDDWLALMAMFPVLAMLSMGIYLIKLGAGFQAHDLPRASIISIVKNFWAASFFFHFGMGLAKFSALAFYVRLFGFRRFCTRTWTVSFCVVTLITAGWLVMTVCYTIFQCRPIGRIWNPWSEGKCISTPTDYLLITAIINVFADVIIVLLPIPQIMNLKMRPAKKLVIGSTLLIGYAIPFICIGRIITIVDLKDELDKNFTYAVIPLGFWLLAEPSLSLFAISLPGALQLIKRGMHHGPRALFTSRDLDVYPERIHIYRGDPESRILQRQDPVFYPGRSKGAHVSICMRAATEKSSRSTMTPSPVNVSSMEHLYPRPLEKIHVKTDIKISYDT